MSGRRARGGPGPAATDQENELALFGAFHQVPGEPQVLQPQNFARAADLAYGLGRVVRAAFGAPGPYSETLGAAFFQGLVAVPTNISTPVTPTHRRPGNQGDPGGGGGPGPGGGGGGSSSDKGRSQPGSGKRAGSGGQGGGKTRRKGGAY